MDTPIYINESYRREETMAIQIILLQLILLAGIYFYFKSESFQSSNKQSLINDSSTTVAPAQPYSTRNIVDIVWSCQPTILPNGEYGCAQ